MTQEIDPRDERLNAPAPAPTKPIRSYRTLIIVGLCAAIVIAGIVVFAVKNSGPYGSSLSRSEVAQGQAITAAVARPQGASAVAKVTVTNSGYSGGYLVIAVSYEGVSGQVSVNPLDWTVVDDNGNVYDAAMMVPMTNGLKSGDLAGGMKMSGQIAFTVTQGKQYKAVWEPMMSSANVWTLTP